MKQTPSSHMLTKLVFTGSPLYHGDDRGKTGPKRGSHPGGAGGGAQDHVREVRQHAGSW